MIVLQSTGLAWAAIAKWLSRSAKTLGSLSSNDSNGIDKVIKKLIYIWELVTNLWLLLLPRDSLYLTEHVENGVVESAVEVNIED